MARKKVEKAHWMPEQEPGTTLRPLTGHRDPMDKHIRRNRVVIELDDAGLRKLQHEAAAVRVKLADARKKLAELKAAMKEPADRERQLLDAMVSGVLEEHRDLYEYADDAAGVVHQYDPATKEKIAEREIEPWEMQDEMDFEDQESEHDAEDEGNA